MAKKATPPRAEADREPRNQCAAVPWRKGEGGGVEILLITSRETRRWVIPKGWPIRGLTSAQSAAREAFEEAGVRGPTGKKPIGVYHYAKRLRSGRIQNVRVAVFLMRVDEECDAWPEMDQRVKQWVPPAEAADLVDEPDLRALLARFPA
jgi:8-oxo-dGTP pyrophosphatase MutT (NUDIX family)